MRTPCAAVGRLVALLAAVLFAAGAAFAQLPRAQAVAQHAPAPTYAADQLLTITLDYDDAALTPMYLNIKNAAGYANSVKLPAHKKKVYQYVPEGVYDIHVSFEPYDATQADDKQVGDAFSSPRYVVAENVAVGPEGGAATLDAATATHFVHFQPRTPEGEPFRYAVFRGDAGFDHSQSNVLTAITAHALMCRDYGYLYMSYITANMQLPDGRAAADCQSFYINDVSDRFAFVETIMAESEQGDFYVLSMGRGGAGLADNNPVENAAYTLREEPITPTPNAEKYHREVRSGIDADMYIADIFLYKYRFRSAKHDAPRFHMAVTQTADAPTAFNLYPQIFEYDEPGQNNTRTQIPLFGTPIQIADDALTYVHPLNDYFTWADGTKLGHAGDNVPVADIVTHVKKSDAGNNVVTYDPQFVGRYGELRPSDIDGMDLNITLDGATVCSKYAGLDAWCATFADDGHTPGTVSAKFTVNNCRVDGVPGTCTTAMTYSELPDKYGLNDKSAPAVQALTFYNAADEATDRYAVGENVVVRFAAIDANGNGKVVNTMALSLRDITLEYAPHGTSTFTKATVQPVRDQQSTAVWPVYGATIQGAALAEGWYDVRITLKDLCKNTTVQTIAPAFKVGNAATPAGPFAGEGTLESPYLLQNKQDMINLSALTTTDDFVKAKTIDTFAGKYFRVTGDIDMEYDEAFRGISVTHFEFALRDYVKFEGIIDGGGHTLRRLRLGHVVWSVSPDAAGEGQLPTVDVAASNDAGSSEGLVGRLGAGGQLLNLNIAADSRIAGYGALAPFAATVATGATISNCRNYADVVVYGSMAAGIAADIEPGATVDGCYNAGNITVGTIYAGGIAARNSGTVSGCQNVGDVVATQLTTNINNDQGVTFLYNIGGIAGEATASGAQISDCLNAGTVSGLASVGGICGSYANISESMNYGMICCDGSSAGSLVGNKTKSSDKYFHHAYYDSQINTQRALAAEDYWESLADGVRATFPTLTAQLCDGTALEGLSGAVWRTDAGVYPSLAAFADEQKADAARRAVATMAPNNNAVMVNSEIALAADADIVWTATGGLAIDGHVAWPVGLGAATLTADVADGLYRKTIAVNVIGGTGIETATAADVAARKEYYNLAGQRTAAPQPHDGRVYVVKTTGADGTVRAEKIVNR